MTIICDVCQEPAVLLRENSKEWLRFLRDETQLPDPADGRVTHDSRPWCGLPECAAKIDKGMMVVEPKNPDGSRAW